MKNNYRILFGEGGREIVLKFLIGFRDTEIYDVSERFLRQEIERKVFEERINSKFSRPKI